MDSHMQATAQGRSGPATYRTTARVVGAIYLAGFVVGIGGNVLIQSVLGAPDRLAAVAASGVLVVIGAVLWLLAVIGDAAHGVLLFPVLRPHHERVAVGYLAFRILDAAFIAVMVLFILLQIPLAREYARAAAPEASSLLALSAVSAQVSQYAYHFGMLVLGVASLMLCYTLHRARLVPRFLAVWGLVGYAVILCGSVVELFGFDLRLIHTIPGGLWEVFIGGWLIAKGFSPSPVPAERAASPTAPVMAPAEVGGAAA